MVCKLSSTPLLIAELIIKGFQSNFTFKPKMYSASVQMTSQTGNRALACIIYGLHAFHMEHSSSTFGDNQHPGIPTIIQVRIAVIAT